MQGFCGHMRGKVPPPVQSGLLRHWQEGMVRNQELAEIMRGLLRERGIQL
jgi:hypothetical protein